MKLVLLSLFLLTLILTGDMKNYLHVTYWIKANKSSGISTSEFNLEFTPMYSKTLIK